MSNMPVIAAKGKCALIGAAYLDALGGTLSARGLDVLPVPMNPNVSNALSFHADLSVCVCGVKRLVLSKYLEGSALVNNLTNRGAEVFIAERDQQKGYPLEASLCACYIGGRLMHNLKYTDAAIKRSLPGGAYTLQVSQGYTRCAVCVVDDDSIITSDNGIHKAAVQNGICSLLISPGYVELPGYDTGFIGGASGRLFDGYIAFTGVLDCHPDKNAIESFIESKGLMPLYLTNNPIFDIGSIICLEC